MYQPGSQLRGLVDDIGQLITSGAQAYKSITAPAMTPFNVNAGLYQGPNINPYTGQTIRFDQFGNPQSNPFPGNIFNAPDMTVPLIIGGGVLLLMFAGMRRRK